MKHSIPNITFALVVAAASLVGTAPAARAVPVDGRSGVHVWIDGGDVFPSFGDVTISLRADRDCYATLFLVDAAGYLHVLYPHGPQDVDFIYAGRTYRYTGWQVGLDRFNGVGVAHVFAVASPVPFNFSGYGSTLFTASFGYRVIGDPFVACRNFYVSLLPSGCRWDRVGVGFARFYVREWVRYPAYLCYGGGVHVRVGDNCAGCSRLYASYRYGTANPYEAMRPAARFKASYPGAGTVEGRIERVSSPRAVRRAIQPTIARRGGDHSGSRWGSSYAGRNDYARVVSTSRSKGLAPVRMKRATATAPRVSARTTARMKSRPTSTKRAVARDDARKGETKRSRRAE